MGVAEVEAKEGASDDAGVAAVIDEDSMARTSSELFDSFRCQRVRDGDDTATCGGCDAREPPRGTDDSADASDMDRAEDAEVVADREDEGWKAADAGCVPPGDADDEV